MTPCDICGQPAINLVSAPSYAWDGNPAFGSFRGYRCKEHTTSIVAAFKSRGHPCHVQSVKRGDDGLQVALKASVRLGDLERRVRLLEEKGA